MPPVQLNPLARGTAVPARRRLPARVGLLAGLLALSTAAACGGGKDVRSQTGPLPSASVTPSTTAVLTARQHAVAGAIAQVNRYERVLDELGSHPRLSLDRLYNVATEPEVLNQIAFFNRFRSAHDRESGDTRIVSIKIQRVSLPRPQHARTARPTIDITACLDVAQVKAFGSDGGSIVPKSRKPFYLTHLRLVNVKYPDPSAWLVTKVSATEEQHSCAS